MRMRTSEPQTMPAKPKWQLCNARQRTHAAVKLNQGLNKMMDVGVLADTKQTWSHAVGYKATSLKQQPCLNA